MTLLEELISVVGEKYCSDKDYINVAYARSLDPVLDEIIPAYAVRPECTEDIVKLVKIANKYKIPIVPRGGGCCLMGGSKPIREDTILLDMTRMDKVLDIDEDNHTVTVQAGLSWSRLNSVLFDKGFYTGNMGPGSGLNAAIGGGLSHHSGGGGGCAKYGECTSNCLGLEVVLATGDLITLGGSSENKWVQKPFVRQGSGPDLMGIFLGDNGTMGIKTTATLKIFPKPPYFAGKTFLFETDPYDKARDAIQEMIQMGWVKHLGIYDVFFTPPPSVVGITMSKSIKSWAAQDIHGGVLFYVTEAFDEKIIERNAEILEKIVKKYATRELGPTSEKGNITDWFYRDQGHWQAYHPLFSLLGADQFAATTEVMVPITKFPDILRLIDTWEEEHAEELSDNEAESGVSHVVMLDHNACYIGSGLTASTQEEYRENILTLWKDQFKMLLKNGSVLYMCGQIGSQVMVDSHMFTDSYYTFFKKIKDLCDPNGIISPGKFRFALTSEKTKKTSSKPSPKKRSKKDLKTRKMAAEEEIDE